MARTYYARDMLPHDVMVSNVVDAWHRSSTGDRLAGESWYDDANGHAHLVADIAGIPTVAGAAVIAVLSPQLEWSLNLAEAYTLATSFADGVLPEENHLTAYRRNIYKAWDILERPAEWADILSGPKVTAFHRAIMGLPGGPCIDRHATRIATAYAFDAVTERTFYAIQDAYIDAARYLSIDVHHLQASVWILCKRELLATIGQLPLWEG